jgi:hypothetical protein
MPRNVTAAGAVFAALALAPLNASANEVDLARISRVEQALLEDSAGHEGAPADAESLAQPAPPATWRTAALRQARDAAGPRKPRARRATPDRTAGGLQGLVLTHTGAPLSNLTVTARGQGKVVTATTDVDGRYRLAVDQGDYLVSVESRAVGVPADHPSAAARKVRLRPGTSSRVDFVLPARPAANDASSTVR